MSQTDPIADMLTRIRNAVQARKKEVSCPSSGITIEIAKILREEGFIKSYRAIEDKKQGILNIILKYDEDNRNAITGIRRISSPGCRIYCTKDSVPKVLDGLGLAIVSTSKGVVSGQKCAEMGIGGEVICSVW